MEKLISCEPPSWLKNNHLQTIVGDLIPAANKSLKQSERFLIDLPDGDTLSCHFYQGTTNLIVTLAHGISGDSHVDYMQRTAEHLNTCGHSVFLFNHRNCGDGFGLSKNPYHAGRGEDIGRALYFLRNKFPNYFHLAIGFSMSGNALLNLLGDLTIRQMEKCALPDYAITINCPINLHNSAKLIHQGFNRIYEVNFLMNFKKFIERKRSFGLLNEEVEINLMMPLIEFDDIYTSPRSGYGSAIDYYRECSTFDKLKNIKIPTVMITSEDDPFVDYKDYLNLETPSNVNIHIEKFGGHMGYLHKEKLPHGTNRWMDYALIELTQNWVVPQISTEHLKESFFI